MRRAGSRRTTTRAIGDVRHPDPVPEGRDRSAPGRTRGQWKHRDGTVTWRWREDDPTATYLTTATVGDFDYVVDSMTSTGRSLPLTTRSTVLPTPAQAAAIQASLDQAPGQLNFLSDLFGGLPVRLVWRGGRPCGPVSATRSSAGQPHYAGSFSSSKPVISLGTQLHEIATSGSATARRCRPGPTSGSAGMGELESVVLERADPGRRRPGGALRRGAYANTPAERWRSHRRSSMAIPRTCSRSSDATSAGRTLQGYR